MTNLRKVYYRNDKICALINPAGQAVHIAAEERCVAEYHFRRFKCFPLSDEDLDRSRHLMEASRWEVRRVVMVVMEPEPKRKTA